MSGLFSDFIFPKKCVFCGDAMPVGAPISICGGCSTKIPYFAGEFLFENTGPSKAGTCDRVVCVMEYSGFVKKAISGFKFHDRREYGRTLAALICDKLSGIPRIDGYGFATCVPLSRERLKERGYNQAEVLAKFTARYFSLPCECRLLIREGQALRQSTLRRGERQSNVKKAFRLDMVKAQKLVAQIQGGGGSAQGGGGPAQGVDGQAQAATGYGILSSQKIILIDDIATSLATINACAATLKASGASEVLGAVLASPL